MTVLLLLCFSEALAAPAPVPWKAGERLKFNIGVGILAAGKSWLEVFDVYDHEISTSGVTKKYKSYRFVALAESNSFVDVFYKVRDKNEAWLDIEDLKTHRFEQHNHEGSYHLDQIVEYDWVNKRWKLTDNVKGRESKIEEGDLPMSVVDTLSSLYLVRTHDLKEGAEISIDVHSGRIYPMVVKVHKKETVRVPAGKFECWLVEPFLKEKGIFIQKGKRLRVWLTADERKIPVKMRAEIFIGHVTAELAEIK